MSKVRVGIVRDHSVSMGPLRDGAKKDYNNQLASLKDQRNVRLSVVECGRARPHWGNQQDFQSTGRGVVSVSFVDVPVADVDPLDRYVCDGGSTPLWSSVDVLIKAMDTGNKNDIYLVMVITDGQENSSVISAIALREKIRNLQATDRWTFVFRVPHGYKNSLVSMGIPSGNIIEWDQTEESLEASSVQTVSATRSYFSDVSKGITSSQSFYTTDLSQIKQADLKRELDDVTDKVRVEAVWTKDDGSQIRDFCIKSFGEFEVGAAYYQLTKRELVQNNKSIIIKHKKKGRYYTGPVEDVREFLGLPVGDIKLVPGNHDDFEVYVKSTSVNRKLYTGTKVLYINR